MRVRAAVYACLPALAILLCPAPIRAQQTESDVPALAGMQRPMITRAQLQASLAEIQQELGSRGYSEALRSTRRSEADAIQERLKNGDLRVGDVLVLQLAGEPTFNHPYTVTPAGTIVLPAGTEISLRGLLRSEVQDFLTQKLGSLIIRPNVQVALTVRLSLTGNIGKPCFSCNVEPGEPLSDFLQAQGGPGQTVDLGRSNVKRGDRVVVDGAEFAEAIRNGRTIDELNLQGGDNIFVGTKPSSTVWARILGAVTGAVGLVYLATRIR
ncbi:MAG: polysaccharide biosynthesis/export family protein [Gemmatimonadales bacterium]